MFDLYSGSDNSHGNGPLSRVPCAFRFRVEADADPDVLARVANQLNIANMAPAMASLAMREDGTVLIQIEFNAITAALAESIHRKIEQLTCVRTVKSTQATAV
jgi:hypothetical protein